ncbi:MAG TPA: histidine phosphatase family protein [Anaerolineales bacterium]|nr:histidine phosphatase family protein [Anaerolineales bacterium]
MKKYLILVKHSLPEIVKNLPARECRLSDEGRKRAHHLAEQLCPFHPQGIVSSSEPKAKETAEIIAERLRLPVQVVDGLHEHDRSTTPFLSTEEFQAAVQEFFEKPDMLVFGSETADETHARFYRAVHSALESHPNETVVIVAHGTVISLFLSRLTGMSGLLLWRELGLPSYIVIDMQTKLLIKRENVI